MLLMVEEVMEEEQMAVGLGEVGEVETEEADLEVVMDEGNLVVVVKVEVVKVEVVKVEVVEKVEEV